MRGDRDLILYLETYDKAHNNTLYWCDLCCIFIFISCLIAFYLIKIYRLNMLFMTSLIFFFHT